MSCTFAEFYHELRDFLDDDARVVSTLDTHDPPTGLHVTQVAPREFAAELLSHVQQAKGAQVLGLCDADAFCASQETWLRGIAKDDSTVILMLGAGDADFLTRVEVAGGHVQHVQDLDALQTGLAAAFISGDTAVIACHVPVADSSA